MNNAQVHLVDWAETEARFGYGLAQAVGKNLVIVRCAECKSELIIKLSSVRINHGKPFNPVCRSCKQKSVWERPEYAQKQAQTQQRLTAERWQSDEYRSKIVAGVTAAHTDNTYRAQAVAAMRSNEIKRLQNLDAVRDGYRGKLVAAAKKNWADQQYRAKLVEKLRSPGTKLKISTGVRAAWSRPEYSKAVLLNSKSKLEENLAAILDNLGIGYDRQHTVGHWPFDFHIPHTPRDILVEVHGEYWHGERFENQRSRDQAKATFIERYHSDKYELKVLWEHEFLSPERIHHLVAGWFGRQPQAVDYKFSQLEIKTIEASKANLFLSKYHHTASGGRSGISVAAMDGDTIVGVARYCYPTRVESAKKQGVKYREIMELTRLAVHPCYRKHNLVSWFLARTYQFLPVKKLMTFADSTYGHAGTIYKASNWRLDGVIRADYFYRDRDGFIMHKKTLWNQSKKMGMSEVDYAAKHGYTRCDGGTKTRFVIDL